MSERIRVNGRFAKKKVIEKKRKALAAIRIVDMMELRRNLIYCNCKEILSLKHIVSERRLGFIQF